MPNYFKVKDEGLVCLDGITIEGDGKEGLGNAAEQFVAEKLDIPVENVREITKEEYDKLDNEIEKQESEEKL